MITPMKYTIGTQGKGKNLSTVKACQIKMLEAINVRENNFNL